MEQIVIHAEEGIAIRLKATISWLEMIFKEQKKKVGITDNFKINEHLHFVNVPPYEILIGSASTLRFLVSNLFSCAENEIRLEGKFKNISKHCLEIHIEIDGKPETFYLKRAWEGAMKEALGLEMNNLLTDTPQRYLYNDEIVVTERMFEPLFPEKVYQLRKTDEYAFAYGKWEVYTRVLRLTDRKIGNVRWSGESLANIDFGLVFYRGDPVFDSRLAIFEDKDSYRKGKMYALEFVLNRIMEHKDRIRELLLNTDSTFCRNLSCHRSPARPLKTILGELKAIRLQEADDSIEK